MATPKQYNPGDGKGGKKPADGKPQDPAEFMNEIRKVVPEDERDYLAIDMAGRVICKKKFILAERPENGKSFLDEFFGKENQEITKTIVIEGDKKLEREVRLTVLKAVQCTQDAKQFVLLAFADNQDITFFEQELLSGGTIQTGDAAGSGRQHGDPKTYGQSIIGIGVDNGQTLSEADKANLQAVYAQATQTSKDRKIAVLDTGIWFQDGGADPTGNCGQVGTGWNFTDNNAIPKDDHPDFHGTKICAIIHSVAPDAQIIPVKVTDRFGVVDYFDTLCGLEYARIHKASVINASWTFSSATRRAGNNQPGPYRLLDEAMTELENEGIYVIAAAGNAVNDTTLNLSDSPVLFPVCYPNANIIGVTSVITNPGGRSLAVSENFSSTHVDIGVLSNTTDNSSPRGRRSFVIPVFNTIEPGTSFATPYVAGRVANTITNERGQPQNSQNLLNQLDGYSISSDVKDRIKGEGQYIDLKQKKQKVTVPVLAASILFVLLCIAALLFFY
ncbi:hypothetical protein GCM10023187_32690 [Nibrella viscosa]|uniref:Peptidase S8/S53 domain-containing protein n=1 Tax=Nibrella viscosa TaxID=1084524 RepID=A0ABP8KM47_9BACT